MYRKALIFSISILLSVAALARTTSNGLIHARLEPESLHYKVMFKWGLINKQAGSAVLSLNHGDKTYESTLTATSAPWADSFFRVRDTLIGRMDYVDFTPLYYEKIAHEGNEDKHDVVVYDYYTKPGTTSANCTRKVVKKGELFVDEKRTMESTGTAVDMLSSFYFMRTLPFEKWAAGHVEVLDIFSGKQKEKLSIVYQGIEDVELDGMMRPCYHITFRFTSSGGKKSSDDMDAWISADTTRIPLKLEGKLPVGKVNCLYYTR